MATINYFEVVKKLVEKTGKREVNWLKVRDNEFKVLLKSAAITISKYHYDPEDQDYVNLRIYNLQGDTVYEYIASENDTITESTQLPFKLLDELFIAARTSYFKVEETIESIIDELTHENEIGAKEDSSKDDLPF